MVRDLPAIRDGRPGRPRRKPGVLVADAGYGFAWLIAAIRAMRITPRLAQRGRSRHGSGLGRWRYVVERTLAWLGNFRRLKVCYERTGEHWQAFHELAAATICARRLQRRSF